VFVCLFVSLVSQASLSEYSLLQDILRRLNLGKPWQDVAAGADACTTPPASIRRATSFSCMQALDELDDLHKKDPKNSMCVLDELLAGIDTAPAAPVVLIIGDDTEDCFSELDSMLIDFKMQAYVPAGDAYQTLLVP
jgi:hypothetical protein